MRVKLERLAGAGSPALEKIDVRHLEGVAYELMQQIGKPPNIASISQLQSFFKHACEELAIEDFRLVS